MPLRNVPITYTIDQQRQEINALAVDVNDIDLGFDERVDDRVAALLTGGTGVTTTYNDANGTLDISLAFNEFSTSAILEGTKLFYTDARANAAIDAKVNQNYVNNLNITNLGNLSSVTLQLGQTTRVLTATNMNLTNWDTAYSWGNHATQGYIKSYTETDTLATVTSRNATTVNTITVGALKTNSIASKLAADNLGITANRTIFINDVSIGSFSTGLANDYGFYFDPDGLLTINHPVDAGGLYLKSAGTTNFFVDRNGKLNGAVKFVTTDGTAGQALTTDGNGQLIWGDGGGANVNISDGLPSSAVNGDLWWESDSGRLKVYYDNGANPAVWVDASPPLEAEPKAFAKRNSVGTVSASNVSTVFTDTNGEFSAQVYTTASSDKIRVDVTFGRLSGTAAADGEIRLTRFDGGLGVQVFQIWTPQNTDGAVSFTFIDEHGKDAGTLLKYNLSLALNVAGSRSDSGIGAQIAIQEL